MRARTIPSGPMSTLPAILHQIDFLRLLSFYRFEYQPWRKRYNAYRDYWDGREAHFIGAFEDKRPPGAMPPELDGEPPPDPGPCILQHETGPVAIYGTQVHALERFFDSRGITLTQYANRTLRHLEAGIFRAVLPLALDCVLAVHANGVPVITDALWTWRIAEPDDAIRLRHAGPIHYKAPRSTKLRTLETAHDPVRVWVDISGNEYAPGALVGFFI